MVTLSQLTMRFGRPTAVEPIASVCAVTDHGGFAAGWYPNPDGGPGLRWYDGEMWTNDYHNDAAPGGGQLAGGGVVGAPVVQESYGSVGDRPIGQFTGPGFAATTAYTPPPARSPFQYFTDVLTKNYANFSGRARRAEYWWFTLFNLLVAIAIVAVAALIAEQLIFVAVLWILATFLPTLAVTVRRLHDTNKSGWFYLISFIPFGGIVIFIFMLIDGDRHANTYGYPPK